MPPSLHEPVHISWHGSYKLANPLATEARSLQGDKILLPHSTLEQILQATPFETEPSPDPWQGNLHSSQRLPSPLIFRLSTDSGSFVYAGIQEFSADEGEVVLSAYLAEALGLGQAEANPNPDPDPDPNPEAGAGADKPTLKVQVCHLPKGTFVRFRPLEAGYQPDDWRALLERQLKTFTTLTKDAILSVRGAKGETFRLVPDKFEPEGNGVCVIDTDAEVDIVPLDDQQALETLRQAAQRKTGNLDGLDSPGGHIDIWKPVEGEVAPGSYVNYNLQSWDRSRPLTITLECKDDGHDIDLFASPRSSRQRAQPTAQEHVWSDMASHDTASISILPTNVELEGAESIHISVHGYVPDGQPAGQRLGRYALRVQSGDPFPDSEPEPQRHGPDDELCSNCRRWIPKSASTMHVLFCARNNALCPKCHMVFKKGSDEQKYHWHCDVSDSCDWGSTAKGLEKHHSLFHDESRDCWEPGCTARGMTLPQLAQHRTSTCPGKLILCQFCHLQVPQEGDDPLNPSAETLLTGLTPHELAEGNRTTNCEICGRIVRLREMAAHVRNHDMERNQQPKPDICRNHLCCRTLQQSSQRPVGNPVGLCSLCFGPLYVSTYDPDHKALRRRVERRYLTQLMTGCGKTWCVNEWCRTGRTMLGLGPRTAAGGGSGTAATLKEVKPLVLGALDPAKSMWFCTDEANQRSRIVAESIAAGRSWDLEWAVAGCEARKGDAGAARDWLARNAPTRKS